MARFDILYAEDEFTNRKFLEIQVTKSGMTCDCAVDGIQALEKLHANQYSVVILDQYMPGLNGDDLAREIRKFAPELPLLAITSDDTEVTHLKDAGFREVFIKPLRGTDYLETIRSYIK